MLVIRLSRFGKKNQPFFKIVVNDSRRSAKAGRFIEKVGILNPLKKIRQLDKERIKYWLSVGAKPSDTVHNLLVSEKIIQAKKIAKHNKPKKKEEDKSAPKSETVVDAKPEAVAIEPKPEPAVEATVGEAKPEPEPITEPVAAETKPEEVSAPENAVKEEKSPENVETSKEPSAPSV